MRDAESLSAVSFGVRSENSEVVDYRHISSYILIYAFTLPECLLATRNAVRTVASLRLELRDGDLEAEVTGGSGVSSLVWASCSWYVGSPGVFDPDIVALLGAGGDGVVGCGEANARGGGSRKKSIYGSFTSLA